MLTQLYIENVAVIEKTEVNFEKGFNVFTGETGAGKSILIDSINAVMGERFSKDLIRNGASKASVTACFTALSDQTKTALEEMGYEAEDELILFRSISVDGKNVCKINGRPATVSILRELSEYLINIHGQHDNQALLNPARHIDYIDAYGGLEELLWNYKTEYAAYRKIFKELSQLRSDDRDRQYRIDLLTYQVNEIEQAEVIVGEEASLQAQRKAIRNHEKLIDALSGAYQALQGDDEYDGAVELTESAADALSIAADYVEDVERIYQRMDEIRYELRDFADEIYSIIDSSEYDAQQLEAIEERLDTIYKLKKKYGGSEEQILEYYRNAKQELEVISGSEERIEALQQQLQDTQSIAAELADELSKQRRLAATQFCNQVEEQARFLNMPNLKITASFQEHEMNAGGTESMELLISANAGETAKPLTKIASGGELSRIMLAIKSVLSKHDPIQTMIFDEIDTGVSGRAAEKIGYKLRETAADKQVICVTHLAQIAVLAQHHLLIEKYTEADKTYTQVQTLDRAGRVREVARIMGGSHITDLLLQNAEQMIEQAEQIQ